MVFRKYLSEIPEVMETEGRFEISAQKHFEWYVNKKICRRILRERKNDFPGIFLQRRSIPLKNLLAPHYELFRMY